MGNYVTQPLRASAATSGASEQDAQVTLPDTVREIWVTVSKTAEANADNLLTVRLQALVNAVWFDLSFDSRNATVATTSAADSVNVVTRTPNIVDASSALSVTAQAHYKSLPSNVIRIISISSGTAVANTFSADVMYMAQGAKR